MVACHVGFELQELIGRVSLQPDGSTGWADGPLITATGNAMDGVGKGAYRGTKTTNIALLSRF